MAPSDHMTESCHMAYCVHMMSHKSFDENHISNGYSGEYLELERQSHHHSHLHPNRLDFMFVQICKKWFFFQLLERNDFVQSRI